MTEYVVVEYKQGYAPNKVRHFYTRRDACEWAFKRAFRKINGAFHGYRLPELDISVDEEESPTRRKFTAEVTCVVDVDSDFHRIDWRWAIQSVQMS